MPRQRHEKGIRPVAEWAPLGRNGVKSILEPAHTLDKICRRRFNEEVVMVSHQNPRPDSDTAPFASFAECFEKQFLVSAVRGDKDAASSTLSRDQRLK